MPAPIRSARAAAPNAVLVAAAELAPPPLTRPLIVSPSPQAGFPSPAADYVEETLDLNRLLVGNPVATFFLRIQGDSMVDAGIHPGDIAVVDRSLEPVPGRIVAAAYDGELYVKRYGRAGKRPALLSANAARREAYPPILLDPERELILWGVVTWSVHKL